MKITKITLVNFRGAQSLSLNLDQRLNVFFGVNGAGKSTVLDAIALMLSWAVSRIRSVGGSGQPISISDITNNRPSALIDLLCQDGEKTIEWKLSKSRSGYGAPEEKSNLVNLNEFTKQLQGKIAQLEENINLPLFVHYTVNRAVLV